MKNQIKTMVSVIFLAVILTTAACAGNTDSRSPADGRLAPEFQLRDLEGELVSLGSFEGRPVMLNFWASWCGPCRDEMPYLQDVSKDPRWVEKGLVLLAINIQESTSVVQKFVDDFGLTFTVLLDTNGAVTERYNIGSIPTTYFIDGDGIIRDVRIGAFARKADIDRALLNSIMKDNP
ncbi:MAG: hypothetical protein A2Z29_03035 [Chloroflexi bacterium RBG_16_56_11]|nr:MAG: hypothetical protein A2Z29_03035 [Chloroflexi bacterium RBG_16_56_11]